MKLRAFILWTITFVLLATTVSAITIQFEVSDLSDTTTGEDRWEYRYTVSDFTFEENHGFTVFFDQTQYDVIEDPAVVNDDWDVIIWQPDATLPDAGAFDALSITSNVAGASLADEFVVQFVWKGSGTPDAQPFEVYDSNFQALATGETTSSSEIENPWDVNRDNVVNIFDLVIVAGQFGQTPPTLREADVNTDGTVNVFDLVLVGSHFGEDYSGAANRITAGLSITGQHQTKRIILFSHYKL